MAVPLRSDFDPAALRSIAGKSKDGPQARRPLALAAIPSACAIGHTGSDQWDSV